MKSCPYVVVVVVVADVPKKKGPEEVSILKLILEAG
jgi:hypothetical protein